MRLLSEGHTNAKQAKGAQGLLPFILYMAPSEKVCPWSVRNGCLKPCLFGQGKGRFDSVQAARQAKTDWFLDDPRGLVEAVRCDLHAVQRKAERTGLMPVVRLDGTSDLGLAFRFHVEFPDVLFYDYTKGITRIRRWVRMRDAGKAKNLHLTFSLGAGNEAEACEALGLDVNVAVPFNVKRNAKLPERFLLRDRYWWVIDGDVDDWRWRDPRPRIVGLRAKGNSAKLDTEGFIR